MSLLDLLGKILNKVRHNALVHWFYQHEALLLLRCGAADYRASSQSKDVLYNSGEELARFVPGERWQRPDAIIAEFEQRLARGEKVATLTCDNRLASFAWLNPHQETAFFPLVQQRVQYPPNSGAIYNIYTHPDYRGRGFYKQVLNGMVSWAFDQAQCVQLITAIEPKNRIAIKANLAIGFKPYCKLSYLKLFGVEKKDCVPLP